VGFIPHRVYALGWVIEPRTEDNQRIFHQYLDAEDDIAAVRAAENILDRELEKLPPGVMVTGAVFKEREQLRLFPRRERASA
jgi:hypothetical protein